MEHMEDVRCDACGELHHSSQVSTSYWVNSVICHSCIEEMEGFFEDDEDKSRAIDSGEVFGTPW